MKGIVQKECIKLIKSYHTTKQDKRKIDYRNKLFEIMLTQMQIWIKSILGKWGIRRSPEEILSLSWDAYMFCLDRYKVGIKQEYPIPKHFFDYTRYYLLIHFAKEQSIPVVLEELVDTLELVDSGENLMFGRILRLYQFRECLPEEHKFVWDDAYMSMSSHIMDKKGSNNTHGLTKSTYYNLKRSYVSIIGFILKG